MKVRSAFHRLSAAILSALFLAGCANPPPPAPPQRSASGKKLRLETVTHDWQTVYGFRPVEDPPPAKTKKPPQP